MKPRKTPYGTLGGAAAVAIGALFLACRGEAPRGEFPGEVFRSADEKEFVRLIDGEHVEVKLAGGDEPVTGTYKIEMGQSARMVVLLPSGSQKTYPFLGSGLLLSVDTGEKLKRVP